MRVVLAYDADPAGSIATERAAEAIAAWTESWGVARTRGPYAMALAAAQQAYDAASARWATLDALVETTPTPHLMDMREAAHNDLTDIAEYVLHLTDRLGDDRPYLQAETADEFIELTRGHRAVEDVRSIDWQRVKERLDLVAFVSEHTELRPRGRSLCGACPLPAHEDSTPSFHVYPTERNWYCFGCQQWGDIFDLAKALGVPITNLTQT
jgi:hypothetical protein